MKKIRLFLIKYPTLFIFYGSIYVLLELIFRHRSDYTMFILAGVCGTLFLTSLTDFYTYETDYIFQSILCGSLCTLSEWICGRIVNQDYHIWDYRSLPFSSPDGQINLFFFLIWCFICAISIPIMNHIEWKFFNYQNKIPPYYVVFGRKYTPHYYITTANLKDITK